MNAGAPIAILCVGAFALWVVYGVARDYRAYRRALRERTVTACEFRPVTPPLALGAPPAHPRRRRG